MHAIINFQMELNFLKISGNIRKFRHFSTFFETDAPLINRDFIELGGWYSHKIKLQYDIYHLNVTKLVTIIQKIIENIKPTTKFTDLRGASLAPIHLGSVWQSCGKPSTKFPHGGLVECLQVWNLFSPIISQILRCHGPGRGISIFIFY